MITTGVACCTANLDDRVVLHQSSLNVRCPEDLLVLRVKTLLAAKPGCACIFQEFEALPGCCNKNSFVLLYIAMIASLVGLQHVNHCTQPLPQVTVDSSCVNAGCRSACGILLQLQHNKWGRLKMCMS